MSFLNSPWISPIISFLRHHIILYPIVPSHVSIPIPSITLICTCIIIYITIRIISSISHKSYVTRRLHTYQQQKKQQQQYVISQVREIKKLQQHDEIIKMSATQVLNQMKQGELSVSSVVTSISHAALDAHEQHNCLTEIFIPTAISQATKHDTLPITSRSNMSLFGLPISIKDNIDMDGLDSTLGLTVFCNKPKKDAPLVKVLRSLGAIPYVKTTVPQTLLSFECVNPLWGCTTNPWNKAYTPGGSSGGESCLVAARGSFIGIGGDVGGSIRIPAHFCGNYSIKVSNRRISSFHCMGSLPGQESVPSVPGIVANNVEDIALLLRELCVPEMFANDHEVIPLPFDENQYKSNKPLRFGYYLTDDICKPTPAVTRAMEMTIAALKQAGHTVVPFEPPRPFHALKLFYASLSADNAYTMTNKLHDEIWQSYVTTSIQRLRAPRILKRTTSFIAHTIFGDEKAAQLIMAMKHRTVTELWALHTERRLYRDEFHAAWHAANLDLIICPVMPFPAIKHGGFKDVTFGVSYVSLYNVLDYAAGVVPITTVKETDVYEPRPNSLFDRYISSAYNAHDAKGLPIGIQVVAPTLREETVLCAMRVIQSLLPFTAKPPHVA